MTNSGFPAWLKRMDNGAIGEARTKAFLMDRFWILERSVDIDGADFIIQRKITKRNLLDFNAPKFGVIQAKFFENPETVHYVYKEYLVNSKDLPRSEFFLFFHSGFESSSELHIISAKDLIENFQVSVDSATGQEKYRVPCKELVTSNRFKVIDPSFVLNRIELALKNSELRENRNFISWALPSVKYDPTEISEEYLEPIDNYWGDIVKEFGEMKFKARNFLLDIDELYDSYKRIAESLDPEEALSIAEEIESMHKGGHGCLYFSLPSNLFNEDFYNVVKMHKEKVQNLKNKGLLDSYLSLQSELAKRFSEILGPKMPLSPNLLFLVDIQINLSSLNILAFKTSLPEADPFIKSVKDNSKEGNILHNIDFRNVCVLGPGQIQYYCRPGRICFGDKKEDVSWKDYFLKTTPGLRDIMDEIYQQIFPE